MPDIHEQYESSKNKQIASLNKKIRAIYEKAIQQIQVTLSTVTYKGTKFNLRDYPALKKRIDAEINRMHGNIYAGVINGIEASWKLSNKKNDLLVDQRLKGKRLKQKAIQVLYDPNKKALEAFKLRTDKGLNLSKRVWNILKPFEKSIEQTIGIGLGTGRSAADMAGDAKKYLNEPDRLFRRVRGDDGKLYLSAAARNYHPGQGVYRSSYQNALRLTATENNIAYRSADHLRWQKISFVVGIEIKLSNTHDHEVEDICDFLKGIYPKDFMFTGWHPRCKCFQIPKMATETEFDKMLDAVLAGEDLSSVPKGQVTETPQGFRDYLDKNKQRIARWKNMPYWMRDNPQYLNGTVNTPAHNPAIRHVIGLAPAGDIVSTQLTKIPNSIKKDVDHALQSIDKIHGDGKLDDIPFIKSRSKTKNAYFATSIGGKAVEIGLTSKAKNPAFSLVHEMGHYLDLYSIGNKGSFGSIQRNSPLDKVIEAAMSSKAIENIQKIRSEGSFEINGKTTPTSWALDRHLNYLIDPKEIWARAYSQFISKRSNSATMLDGLKKQFENELKQELPYSHQWQDDDFIEIEKQIEKLFIDLGWMTNR